MNAQVPAVQERHSLKEVPMGQHGLGAHLMPESMADVVRFAQTMAGGAIAIRKHLRDNPGACLAVTLQALDWGMNPISVANKSYAVNDQLAYESQLIAAVIHSRAPIKGRPRYIYTGDATKTRQCKVEVTTLDGEVLDYTSPEVGKITTKNSPLWKTDEDQQLGYFSIRSLCRRHFPELLLGVYDREEVQEVRDVTPRAGTGMRARLEARQAEVEPNGGFDAEHIEAALAGQHEEIAEAEFVADAEEPAPVDEVTAEVETTAAAEPEAPDGFDPVDWAGSFTRGLASLQTVEEVTAAWSRAKADGYIRALRAKSEDLAQQLAAAKHDRIAEISKADD